MKATPGVAQFVEACKSRDDCFVDPEPEIQGDEASANADPQIISMSGAMFDLFKPGRTELLTIPEGASAEDALKQIERVTDYRFFYIDSWLQNQSVSGDYQHITVRELLKLIFEETVINFYFYEDNRVILTQNSIIYDSISDDFFEESRTISIVEDKNEEEGVI